jgi:GTP pyrophosphokinase
MAERHVSFEQITDIMAFRVLVDDVGECYKALGVLHQTWQMIRGGSRTISPRPRSTATRACTPR